MTTQLTATELARAIREEDCSAAEVVDAHLDHIDALNPSLNAIITLAHDAARSRAKQADEALASPSTASPVLCAGSA